MKTLIQLLVAFCMAISLLVGSALLVSSQVNTLAGLAVAQGDPPSWRNVRDYIADNVTDGILMAGCVFWDGTNADRCRGSLLNGIEVDVTRVQGSIDSRLEQSGTLFNSQTVGAANTAVTVDITGVSGESVHVYRVMMRCSPVGQDVGGGTIQSPIGTNLWTAQNGRIGTDPLEQAYTGVPLTAADGDDLRINLPACGAGNQGVLEVQADRW